MNIRSLQSYINNKKTLYVLGAFAVVCVCLYLFLLASTTTQVTMRKSLMGEIRDTQGAVADLESEYLAQRESLSIAVAYQRGFVDEQQNVFAYSAQDTSMALADSAVQ